MHTPINRQDEAHFFYAQPASVILTAVTVCQRKRSFLYYFVFGFVAVPAQQRLSDRVVVLSVVLYVGVGQVTNAETDVDQIWQVSATDNPPDVITFDDDPHVRVDSGSLFHFLHQYRCCGIGD